MRSPFKIAQDALQLTEPQMLGLIEHWYLSGQLAESVLDATFKQKHFNQVSDTVRGSFKASVRDCTDDDTQRFNAGKFLDECWTTSESSSQLTEKKEEGNDSFSVIAIALALIGYFQQTHFTKGDTVEDSASYDTSYTIKHSKEIQVLAEKFGMLDSRLLETKCEFAFIIGGRAATNGIYIRELLAAQKEGKIKQACLFISSRLLKSDQPDNPKRSNTFMFDGKDSQSNYQEYLKQKLDHYNTLLKKHCPNFTGFEELTEGISLMERYDAMLDEDESLEKALREERIHLIFAKTGRSDDFYETAILKLPENFAGHVAVSSIQPHIVAYTSKVQILLDVHRPGARAHGYGASGKKDAKIFAQSIARLIDACYDSAVQKIVKGGCNLKKTIPRKDLQFSKREDHCEQSKLVQTVGLMSVPYTQSQQDSSSTTATDNTPSFNSLSSS